MNFSHAGEAASTVLLAITTAKIATTTPRRNVTAAPPLRFERVCCIDDSARPCARADLDYGGVDYERASETPASTTAAPAAWTGPRLSPSSSQEANSATMGIKLE